MYFYTQCFMSLHHCSVCLSSLHCAMAAQIYENKRSATVTRFVTGPIVLWFPTKRAWTHQVVGFTIPVKSRDEVYEVALNAAQGSVFFHCNRGEGERGGIWLLSPHPQSVRGGFRKKGSKTWDVEITRDTNKEIGYTFGDPRAAVSRTD